MAFSTYGGGGQDGKGSIPRQESAGVPKGMETTVNMASVHV